MKILDIRKRILKKKNAEREDKLMKIVDRRFDGFFQVPDILIDEYVRVIGMGAVAVYLSMCRHANRDRQSWPGMRKMCFELGMGASTVNRGIKVLEAHSMIKVDRKHRAFNIYSLLKPFRWKKTKVVRYGVGKVRPATKEEISNWKRDRRINSPSLCEEVRDR